MVLANLHKISKSFAGKDVFSDVSIQIRAGEKIALVGRNGVGKTTLFRILLGDLTPDRGETARARGVRIGYLPQEVAIGRSWTLMDEVIEAFSHLIEMRERIAGLEQIIAAGNADGGEMTEYGHIQERFEREGGFTFEYRIDEVLQGLGFLREEYTKPLSRFSGGEKSRAYLAKLLLLQPDILLLDEPTNHLDIASTEWLETYLNELDAAVIAVSHDRLFLSRTTKRTCELTPAGIDDYAGNFDFYLVEREKKREQQAKLYQRQAEEVARIEDFIQRNIAGQKTKQAQSRRKMLAKMKRLAPPDADGRAAAVKIRSSGRSHLSILKARGLSKSFGGRSIFSDVSFEIRRGDKIGLIGPNGSGKSTLVKIVTGELEADDGDVNVGGNVTPAYFDQELSILNDGDTVLDSVWEEKPQAEAGELRSYLGRYLFSGDDVFKSVSALSGGEKSRLALAKILLLPANFLILDEPTNHLDIQSCERLEEALSEYDGAALIISHDRYFLDKTANRIFVLENGRLQVFAGSYTEFAEAAARETQAKQAVVRGEKKEHERKARLKEWEELKEKRRLRKQLEKLENDISVTETRIKEIDLMLEDEFVQKDWERLTRLQETRSLLEGELDELIWRYNEFESK